jgi:hypothetical protein
VIKNKTKVSHIGKHTSLNLGPELVAKMGRREAKGGKNRMKNILRGKALSQFSQTVGNESINRLNLAATPSPGVFFLFFESD